MIIYISPDTNGFHIAFTILLFIQICIIGYTIILIYNSIFLSSPEFWQ